MARREPPFHPVAIDFSRPQHRAGEIRMGRRIGEVLRLDGDGAILLRGPALPGKPPSQCSAVYICMPASVVHTSMRAAGDRILEREAVLQRAARAVEHPAIVVDTAHLPKLAEVPAGARNIAQLARGQQQLVERQISRPQRSASRDRRRRVRRRTCSSRRGW